MTEVDEIMHAEDVLQRALKELAGRIAAGRRDDETSELLRHCQEMSEILHELVAKAGSGEAQEAAKVRAASLDIRLAELQDAYGRQRLH
jgi:hypothetical protein